jgi:hypothetical protein
MTMQGRALLFGGLLTAAVLAAALPLTASAQHVSRAYGPITDRFQLEPYTGRYFDNVTHGASSFDDSGWLGGLRLGVAIADRTRLLGDLAYSQVTRSPAVIGDPGLSGFESQSWLVTGGLEFDVVPGDTRASLSLQSGQLFRRGRGGDIGSSAWDLNESALVVVPGFSLSQRITPRADIRLGVQDYVTVRTEPVSHNWAVVAGLTLR